MIPSARASTGGLVRATSRSGLAATLGRPHTDDKVRAGVASSGGARTASEGDGEGGRGGEWRARARPGGAARPAPVALRLDNLRYDSLHDPLTKLYNRRSFDDQRVQAVSRARRYDDPFTLVTIDLDLFKVVNDSYGHAGGDDVLRAIGAAMRHALRQSDVAARTGGDEFALILPGGDADVVAPLIERLRDGVRALDRDLPVDFSVGVASCPGDADTVETLTALADTRLYADKARRRAERAERG